ncbi:hypothetical protein GCM10010842_08530 [Deinococcus daejeonensis]|uniref:Uncharacterized protein n=1 Tax=Deinococcus daejeonensis TaxID=1007098 RepID=A0ABQ2IXX9_9DEIO|nr:hypothetical protein GCM10010842_08530 [Deinococcus daejeonensis]
MNGNGVRSTGASIRSGNATRMAGREEIGAEYQSSTEFIRSISLGGLAGLALQAAGGVADVLMFGGHANSR